MPRATISTDSQRFELKSLPEGFVTIRRMSYGRWLERQEMALQIQFNQSQGKGKGMQGDVKALQRITTEFEFKECIVDHNLTDDNDTPLDFRAVGILQKLDPRVGNEIESIIQELHDVDTSPEGK